MYSLSREMVSIRRLYLVTQMKAAAGLRCSDFSTIRDGYLGESNKVPMYCISTQAHKCTLNRVSFMCGKLNYGLSRRCSRYSNRAN